MNNIYAIPDPFEVKETDNRINGLGNILPYLVLQEGAPSNIEGTLYRTHLTSF